MAEPKEALQRGDETRAQLLDAALQLFAVEGYEAVSTRQLAAKSGTNIAAIGYHFGGKRELYRALLHQLVADTEPFFGPASNGLRAAIIEAKGNQAALAEIVSGFVQQLLSIFIGSDFMRWRAPLVMHEYSNPSEDFDILYQGRIAPLHQSITAIVSAALGRDDNDPRCAIRAHAVMGQIFVYGIARVVLWRRLGWDSYGPDAIEMIIEEVRASVLASLGLPMPPTGGAGEKT
ncbi:MAG: CerR family C-terminal domain-containing protein [Rhodospirillales bacterium]|nr:CerR family C-terminal domain-containing protein [Rhodospirillales bacterium]